MNLICLGINHRTAPIAVRESVWYSNEEIAQFLLAAKGQNVRECVLVSTCNRTELYAVRPTEDSDPASLLELLVRFKGAESLAASRHFYTLRSLGAARHIFNVAAGVDSMVLGDVQILGQMKEAFEIAQSAKSVGTILSKLFEATFHVGKRARTETGVCHGAVSVSYAAVELASKIFDDLSQRRALLIGAGETGKLTARHLMSRQIGQLFLTNRTRQRAEEIAALLGGTVVEFEQIQKTMEHVDIVITSVDTAAHILSGDDLHAIMKRRSNNPLFIIDIGVPRNVDPKANDIDNVFLHDIDALNLVVDRNLEKRRAEISKVRQIVHEEVLKYYQWHNALQVTPTIQELREQFETIRQQEMNKALHRFSPEQRESLEILTKRIVNKILHTPMTNLKDGANGEASEETLRRISVIRSLFGLGPQHDRKDSDED